MAKYQCNVFKEKLEIKMARVFKTKLFPLQEIKITNWMEKTNLKHENQNHLKRTKTFIS